MQIPFYDSQVWKLGSPGFRTSLEVAFHNLVHRWVNGTMMNMTSPNDPVFWLHHANVDRLWVDWQRQHPTVCPFLPSKHAPKGHNLYDILLFSSGSIPHPHTHNLSSDMEPPHNHSTDGDSGIQTMRIVNTLNHYLLDYMYDTDPKEETEETDEMKKVKPTALAPQSRKKHKIPAFPTMDEII